MDELDSLIAEKDWERWVGRVMATAEKHEVARSLGEHVNRLILSGADMDELIRECVKQVSQLEGEANLASFVESLLLKASERQGLSWLQDHHALAQKYDLVQFLALSQLIHQGVYTPQDLFTVVEDSKHFTMYQPEEIVDLRLDRVRQAWEDGTMESWLNQAHPDLVNMPAEWVWEALATPEVKAEVAERVPQDGN